MRAGLLYAIPVLLSLTPLGNAQAPDNAMPVPGTASLQTLEDRISALERRLDAQAGVTNRIVDQLEQITQRLDVIQERLGAISKLDGSQFIPDLAAMETSPRLREDLYRAVNGTLEIDNQMQQWMRIYVNGASWRFPPGVSSIAIPYGPVSTQFANSADRRDWSASNWELINGEHRLRLRLTNNIPQPGP